MCGFLQWLLWVKCNGFLYNWNWNSRKLKFIHVINDSNNKWFSLFMKSGAEPHKQNCWEFCCFINNSWFKRTASGPFVPFHAYTGVVLALRQQVFSAFSKPVLESSAGKEGVLWVFIFPEDVKSSIVAPYFGSQTCKYVYLQKKKKSLGFLIMPEWLMYFFFSLTWQLKSAASILFHQHMLSRGVHLLSFTIPRVLHPSSTSDLAITDRGCLQHGLQCLPTVICGVVVAYLFCLFVLITIKCSVLLVSRFIHYGHS